MKIQTHGFEKEENEHDVVDKVYSDIKPRPQQSEVVQSLKNQAGEEWKSRCTEHYAWKAAEHIIQLEEENKFLKKLINKYHLKNDAFTGKGNIND